MSALSRTLFTSARRISATQRLARSAFQQPARTIITLKNEKYTAHAVAQGAGRNGTVECEGLKLNLATPKELGGTGGGENPEQLFAAGYASCLLGAIQLMGRQIGKTEMAKNAVVRANVTIGEAKETSGFAIKVDIKVEGIDEELLQAGHGACPYSRALTQRAEVNVSLA